MTSRTDFGVTEFALGMILQKIIFFSHPSIQRKCLTHVETEKQVCIERNETSRENGHTFRGNAYRRTLSARLCSVFPIFQTALVLEKKQYQDFPAVSV